VAWAVSAAGDDGARAERAAPTGATPGGGSSAPTTSAPTTTVPSTTPSPSATPKGALVIHATGDVSLDPNYIPAFRTNGYDWAWSGLEGLFEHDDLTIINHECPSTTVVAPVPKEFSFRCDPNALPAAKRAGVDVANLGNNHAFDQGPQGLLDSLKNLDRAGIVAIGAGKNERDADAPRYVDVNGWHIGLVGVAEVLDPENMVAVGDEPGTAVGHDFPRALAAIREAEANSDLVIVMLHWGVELDTQPRDYQVDEAHRMIEAGADVIFGSHAHRLQPMDTIDGVPVFYGLGNFVWPNFSTEGSTTAVAEVHVSPDGDVRGRLLPAFIVSPGHPVLR
jgi:poly-gamma-glutamate synthesis protein (capsule biosynthesis protein)